MPIDPNIILQGMPQGVDVNALMQQQMQGLQNINVLERQRRADEAAAQEAMQVETLRALSPAVAAAFEDPSDAGLEAAFSMVPEEFGAAADEQLAQLRAIPDVGRRKAVIRSALLQDDYGRALLAQLEPTANMRLQEGTAARRAALDERRLALEEAKLKAEGQGDWKLQEGEGGFFWVNPRTREVVPADVTGGAASFSEPDLVTPRAPAPGAPDVEAPISVAQPPAEQPRPQFKPTSKTEKSPDLTEREGKSVNFAIRMADSDAIANELEKEGVVTTDTVSNFFTGVVSALPLSAGANLATQLENAFNAAMPTMSLEEQRLAGAQLDFITAVLRSESGAEIKTSEFPAEYRKYFAVAGDENNPKLLTDKKRRRRNAIEGMKAQAGERGRAEIDRILKKQSVDASVVTPPAPGATLDGFEYQGVEE